MPRLLKTVNCLYFPSCDSIPLHQLIDDKWDSMEEYMNDYISTIQLPLEQAYVCKLMAKMGNGRSVYISSCLSTFIEELVIGLNEWSKIQDNTHITIILNLAYGARIYQLLKDDNLLVRPLMRIMRWLEDRGIEIDIGLPLAHSFYPHTYDIHIFDGDYPNHARVVNMIIVLRSMIVNSRTAVIDRGILKAKSRFNEVDADRIIEVIRDYYSTDKVLTSRMNRVIKTYRKYI